MSNKILTISLLVSGRAATTKKCLDSLKGIRDQIECELILVDTGCGEKLRRELFHYTDQVIPFTWCDDFAKARNEGLKRASGEWFLYLDDDEWFDDVTPIVDFFQSGEYREYDQAVYRQRNYENPEGTRYTDDWASRLIHLQPDTHFEGRVHESLVPAVGKCKKLETFVHHYGYVFASEEEKQKHFRRNTDILLRLVQEEPDNMRWRLQLLQEYYSIGDGANLRKTGEDALALIREIDSPFVNECRSAFQTAVLLGNYLEERYEELELRCGEYLADPRNSTQGQCSICVVGAKGAQKYGDKKLLAQYCTFYFQYIEAHQNRERDEQQQIIEESIVLVKDTVSAQTQEDMRNRWAWALSGLGRPQEFPQEQKDILLSEVRQMIDGNGEFLFLPDGIWEIAAGGVLPLEDMLLELPVSQWMAMVMVLEAKNDPAAWRTVIGHLASIRTKEDIRYDYLDMHDANILAAGTATSEDYDAMCKLLQYFAKSNLSFARRVYTQKAFEGEMEMLPDSCRGAIWIERMLACGEQEWTGKLECLKKSALEWSALGETAKHFAKLIGKEQEKVVEQAADANRQLYIMAEQVKKQVRALMDAGMNAEALSVVKQLRAMLPDDAEAVMLERELME